MKKKILSVVILLLTSFMFTASAEITIDSIKTVASSCSNNGSITLFVKTTGGTLLYTVTSGPATFPLQTGNVFSSLSPGDYTIEISTTDGEKRVILATVEGNYQLPDFVPLVTPPDCPDNSTGIIDGNLTPTSGLAPFSWELIAPSQVTRPAQSDPVFKNLPQGNYTLRMSDACGNIQTKSIIIFTPPNTMTEITDFVNITGCDTAEANVLLLISADSPPYKASYTAGGKNYIIDAAELGNNGGNTVQLVLPAPNISYGDAFTNITITNACGTQVYIPQINICPFVFGENFSIAPGPNCSAAIYTSFYMGTPGVCGNSSPKFPVTIAIRDATTNTVIETKSYTDPFSASFGTVAMLPGSSYSIDFTDGCNHKYTQNLTIPAKDRYVDYSVNGQQPLLDSTAITYVYAHGFPSTGTTFTITGGPVSAHSTKKGYQYSENYVYPKSFAFQEQSDSSLICPIYNTAPGTYYYTIKDSCGNIFTDSFIVYDYEVASFYYKYSYIKGCAGEAGLQYEYLHNTFSSITITDIKTGAIILAQAASSQQNPNTGVLNNLKATDYQVSIDYFGPGIDQSLTNNLVDSFKVLDTIHILPYQNPSLQSSSSILCGGALSLVLTADSSKGIPPYQYEVISGPQLFPPQTSNLFELTQKGLYRIRLIDKCGNSTATDVTVDDRVFPPLSKIGNSCINGIARLTYGASSYFSYTWTRPNGTIFNGDTLVIDPVTAADTGIYTISRLTTINGCSSTQSATYRLMPGAQDSSAISICAGQSYTFGNRKLNRTGIYRDTIPGPFCDSISILHLTVGEQKKDSVLAAICGGQTYIFGNRSLDQTGIYSDTLTSTTGCDSISIVNLFVDNSKKDSVSVTICAGQSYLFGTRSLDQAGVYSDSFATASCDSISILNLIVKDYNRSDTSVTICAGQFYTFGNRTFTQTGNYSDTLKTGGCDSISTLSLTVNNPGVVKAQSDKYTVLKGETIHLSVTAPDLSTYLWSALNPLSNSTISNPTSTVNVSSFYKVVISDANNCSYHDSLFVQVVTDSIVHTCANTEIYFPSAFTPNNDGKNDLFRPGGISNTAYQGYHMVIYNRWGQKVFESNNSSNCWNGRYNNRPAEQGNYVYTFSFTCEDGRTFTRVGNIVLLR